MVSSNISPENLESYINAEYHVYSESKFILKVGKTSSDLLNLYQKFNRNQASFLTAYNPLSQEMTTKQNKSMNSKLESLLIKMNYPYILSEGICPETQYPGEKSFLVFGTELSLAKELGNQFHQNAILWINNDAIPQLILLK